CASKLRKSALALPLGSLRLLKSDSLLETSLMIHRSSRYVFIKPFILRKGVVMQKRWMRNAFHFFVATAGLLGSSAIMAETIQPHCAYLPIDITQYGKQPF